MTDYTTMTDDELRAALAAIRAEMDRRAQYVTAQTCIYTHDCADRAKYHLNKYKHWSKLVTEIDSTRCDGYALVGKWLNVTAENLVARGSVVVECCDDDVTAYAVCGDREKEEIAKATRGRLSGLIANVKSYLEGDVKND